MGSIDPPEVSLDCKTKTYIPKTITQFLEEVSMIRNVTEKMLKIEHYVKTLEDEMNKIHAFQRQLPLCFLLLNDVIAALRAESMQYKKSIVEPILEEFMPLKESSREDDKLEGNKDKDSREKMNWMSSVQLWNSDRHSPNADMVNNKQSSKLELKKSSPRGGDETVLYVPFQSSKARSVGKAFAPFKGCSGFPAEVVRKEDKDELHRVPGLSLCTPGIKNLENTMISGLSSKPSDNSSSFSIIASSKSNIRTGSQLQQQQTARKQRRCWSQELHRRFIDALQQLGGSQAATPKQIRELMQVDGLTNDEVKSHLQKYRLHIRKLPNTSTNEAGLLGNLWMPQDKYGESSKHSSSQSGSPQCPFQLEGSSRGTSMTGEDSMEEEDDEKFESHSWKVQKSGKNDV